MTPTFYRHRNDDWQPELVVRCWDAGKGDLWSLAVTDGEGAFDPGVIVHVRTSQFNATRPAWSGGERRLRRRGRTTTRGLTCDPPVLPLPERRTDMPLPTFEEMRRNAHRLLGDVLDELRSDWAPGTGPTDRQADAVAEARQHIAKAKAALDRAAR